MVDSLLKGELKEDCKVTVVKDGVSIDTILPAGSVISYVGTPGGKKKHDNVVHFPMGNLIGFMTDIERAYNAGVLTDFAAIWRTVDKKPDDISEVEGYWFGEESSVMVLGLVERLRCYINEYIDDLE